MHFPLSGPVLTYISLLIIPCMIVYVTNNKEPWTLNLIISLPPTLLQWYFNTVVWTHMNTEQFGDFAVN